MLHFHSISVNPAKVIKILRYLHFGVLMVASMVVLGLDAYVVQHSLGTKKYNTGSEIIYYTLPTPIWAMLGIGICILTFLSIGFLVLNDLIFKLAFPSTLIFEVLLFVTLDILWIGLTVYTPINLHYCYTSFHFHGVFIPNPHLCVPAKVSNGFYNLTNSSISEYLAVISVVAMIARLRGKRGIWRESILSEGFLRAGVPKEVAFHPKFVQEELPPYSPRNTAPSVEPAIPPLTHLMV